MGKLILLFILANLTQNQLNSETKDDQEEVKSFAYWNTFSETFEKTADFWQAESAALEAEEIAEERTGVEEWLSKNKNNIHQIDSCTSKKDDC
jgi:hypothetical protein